jgi:hypothetical protein
MSSGYSSSSDSAAGAEAIVRCFRGNATPNSILNAEEFTIPRWEIENNPTHLHNFFTYRIKLTVFDKDAGTKLFLQTVGTICRPEVRIDKIERSEFDFEYKITYNGVAYWLTEKNDRFTVTVSIKQYKH